jgi:hypothetical protein
MKESSITIVAAFSHAVKQLQAASRMLIEDYGTAEAYRDQLVLGMTEVKAASVKVLQSGHYYGIEQLSGLKDKIQDLCEEDRHQPENQIFWDVLADHFPPMHSHWWMDQNLPGPLLIKLGAAALDQMPVFEDEPHEILKLIGNDHFMDGLTMVIKRMMPPHRRFDMGIHKVMSLFADRLSDDRFRSSAVDYLLAHQAFFFPVIDKLLMIGKTQPIKSAKDPGAIIHLIEQHERELLGKLDYTPDEIDQLYVNQEQKKQIDIEYAQHTGRTEPEIEKIRRTRRPPSELPSHADLQQINKSLAWPAEFLVMLQDASQQPLAHELILLAFEFPSGNRPYLYLEKFGIVLKPDWHMWAQEKSSTIKTMLLYEHAIHTDGIELSTLPLNNLDFKLGPSILSKLLCILADAPLDNPESRRKAQLLMDALIRRAELPRAEKGIVDQIISSAINPRLYGNHLRGRLLEDRLGL